MTKLLNFSSYESRPIFRNAACIPEGAVISYSPEKSEATVLGTTFKCYEEPKPLDYVVHLSDTDVYHCSREVFLARNIDH